MIFAKTRAYANYFYSFEKLLLLALFIAVLTGDIARWFPPLETLQYLFLYMAYMPLRIVIGNTKIPLLIAFPIEQTTGLLASCSICTSYNIFIISWEVFILAITVYPPARSKFQERVVYYFFLCKFDYVWSIIQFFSYRRSQYLYDFILLVLFVQYLRPLILLLILIIYFSYMALKSVRTPAIDMRNAYALPQIDESRWPILRSLELRLIRTVG